MKTSGALDRVRRRASAILDSESIGAAFVAVTVVLVVAPVAGLLLVVASHLVPDAAIVERLDVAIDRNTLVPADYGQALSGRQIDYFTDCIGITIGLPDAAAGSALRSAIATPTAGGCTTAVPALIEARETGEIAGAYDYFRYWHGYTVVTRPAIVSVGVDGARMVVLAGLVVAAAGLARSITTRHGWRTAAVLLAPFALTTDVAELPRSLPHGIAAALALGAAWMVHARVSARPTLGRVAALSAVSGATFVYFDILTMPPGAAVLTVGCAGLALVRSETGRRLATGLGVSFVAWWAAWVVTWVWKWVIASTVFGVSTVVDVIRFTAEVRLSGSPDAFDFGFLQTSRLMVVVWRNQPLTVPVVLFIVLFAGWVAWRRWQPSGRLDRPLDRLLVAAPALTTVLWYEVMRNHSQNHGFFTYRSLALSLGLVLAAVVIDLTADDSAPLEAEETDHERREDELGADRHG